MRGCIVEEETNFSIKRHRAISSLYICTVAYCMANHIYILYNIYIYININIYLSIYTLLCKPSDYNEEFPLRSASSSLFSARSNVQGVRIELETSRLRDFEAQGSRESFGTARDCFGNGAGARTTCSRTSDT